MFLLVSLLDLTQSDDIFTAIEHLKELASSEQEYILQIRQYLKMEIARITYIEDKLDIIETSIRNSTPHGMYASLGVTCYKITVILISKQFYTRPLTVLHQIYLSMALATQ